MLLWMLDWLRTCCHCKIPFVFAYFSTRMILAAATSLLFTILLGPRFIKKLYEWKIGQSIRSMEECPLLAELHSKKKETPTMGGILILSSMLFSLLLWMDLQNNFTILLLITTLVLGSLGGVDDYLKLRYKNSKGLKARWKMGIQLLFSCLVGIYLLTPGSFILKEKETPSFPIVAKEQIGSSSAKLLTQDEYMSRMYLPFFKEPIWIALGAWRVLVLGFIMFVITGSSNAVNLTDGLDGLAAGCVVMVSLVLGLVAFLSNHLDFARYLNILYIEGSGEIAVYLFALVGASLGFLWYNGYPAQVFMGDTGSLALGGILGLSSVLLRREVLLAVAGAVFVAEAVSVILQVLSYRYRHKKRIFLCAPLHHHFEYKGWPETKIVVRFWIMSLLFSMIAVVSLKFQ